MIIGIIFPLSCDVVNKYLKILNKYELDFVFIFTESMRKENRSVKKHIVFDFNDENSVTDLYDRLMKLGVEKIIAASEFGVTLKEKLACYMYGVNNNSVLCQYRNKAHMRKGFYRSGIIQPEVLFEIKSRNELDTIKSIDFPVIVKPVELAGSMLVNLCYSLEELRDNVIQILRYESIKTTNEKITNNALIEEYITGQEYSFECIIYKKNLCGFVTTKKYTSEPPQCDELGHMIDVELNDDCYEKVSGNILKIIKCWEIDTGILHVEMKYFNNNFYVIEAANRIAGGYISHLVELKYGICLEELLIQMIIETDGFRFQDIFRKTADNCFYAIKYFFENAKQYKQNEDCRIQNIKQYKKTGGVIINENKYNTNNRLGHVIYRVDNENEFDEIMKEKSMKNNAVVMIWDYVHLFKPISRYKEFYRILITEKSRNLDSDMAGEYFDQIVIIEDLLDKDELDDVMNGLTRNYNIAAIYGTSEKYMEISGYLRDKFCIEGQSEHEALLVRNKYMMKKTARKNGISTTQFFMPNNIDEKIIRNNLPLIIKPVDGSGTRDTSKIGSVSEYYDKVKNIGKDLNRYIVEKYVDGEEYHIDCIVQNKKVLFTSIGKYLNNCLDAVKNRKVIGSILLRSDGDGDLYIKLINYASTVIEKFNIKNAVTHLEVFVSSDNILFSEIATRIGGGPLIGGVILQQYGVNIYECYIDAELGNCTVKINDSGKYTGFVAFPSLTGIITGISSESDFSDIQGIKVLKIYNQIGDILESDPENTMTRTGYAIIEDNSYDKLKEKLNEVYSRFELKVDKKALN